MSSNFILFCYDEIILVSREKQSKRNVNLTGVRERASAKGMHTIPDCGEEERKSPNRTERTTGNDEKVNEKDQMCLCQMRQVTVWVFECVSMCAPCSQRA